MLREAAPGGAASLNAPVPLLRYGSMTMVQVYVPGTSPVALTDTGSPDGAEPAEPQSIVEFVAPGTCEVTVTDRSVSGESLKLAGTGVPVVQVAVSVGV